jgi:outer membrane cobalamin receptor
MLAKTCRSIRPERFTCVAFGALACAGVASAGEDVTVVDTLIITSQSLEQTLPLELSKYGNDIEIIDADLIADQSYVDINDALRMQTPGLYLQPRGGPFSYVDLSLHGSRTDDVLWLVDGVRINNRLYNSTSPADTLPSNMVERIEVLKGGQGLFYGTSAAAGVINVVTRAFSDEPGGEVSIGGHTNDGYHFSGMARGAVGGHKYVVYGSSDQADGYETFSEYEPSATDRDRSYDVASYGLKYGYDFSDALNVNVRYQYTDAEIDYLRPTLIVDGTNHRYEDIISANIDYAPNDVFQLFVKAYWHNWDSYYTEILNDLDNPGALDVVDLNTGWWFKDRGVNVLTQFSPGGGFEYLAGYDYQTYEGQDDVLLIGRQTETVNAAILQVRTTEDMFDNALFAAGARYNDTDGASVTVWNASGHVDVTPDFYVEGTVGTAFILPDAWRLFGNDPCCAFGDPDLEPEESINYNVSVGGFLPVADGAQWQLTYFDRKVDNFIGSDFAATTFADGSPLPPEAPGVRVNIPGESTFRGWEASTLVYLDPTLTLNASYTSQEAEAGASNFQINNIPESFAKVGLTYEPAQSRFGGSVTALWTGEIFGAATGVDRTNYGDYALVDLAGHYYLDADRRTRLTVRVENLFDEEYSTRVGSALRDGTSTRFRSDTVGVPQTVHVTFTRAFGAE